MFSPAHGARNSVVVLKRSMLKVFGRRLLYPERNAAFRQQFPAVCHHVLSLPVAQEILSLCSRSVMFHGERHTRVGIFTMNVN
jgi:hypothetical protein